MRKPNKLVIATLLCVGTLAMTTPPAHATEECKGRVVATGATSSTWLIARRNAREAWIKQVGNTYGFKWTNYDHANNTSKQCWSVGRNRKQCAFIGDPCPLW